MRWEVVAGGKYVEEDEEPDMEMSKSRKELMEEPQLLGISVMETWIRL